jgi:hypothetical protein
VDYDAAFYDENIRTALIAAKLIIPWVLARTEAKSVIDVGCGSGAWLSAAKSLGCGVYGVDENVPDDHLLIDAEEFERADISEGVDCSGYDLAICLEVGEHVEQEHAAALVAGLCGARYVLWSAAVPGQGGVNHVNERWPSWWEPWFQANGGYVGSSEIRKPFWDESTIAPFYRQNLCLYAKSLDLLHLGLTPGVADEVHPDNPHIPQPCSAS